MARLNIYALQYIEKSACSKVWRFLLHDQFYMDIVN